MLNLYDESMANGANCVRLNSDQIIFLVGVYSGNFSRGIERCYQIDSEVSASGRNQAISLTRVGFCSSLLTRVEFCSR